jgi:glycerophosphoryl diester phosphodiesterase
MRHPVRVAAAGIFFALGGCGAPVDPGEPTVGASHAVVTTDQQTTALQYSASRLLGAGVRPLVIGHEGAGENFGADPTKPINDTVESVRLGYDQGAALVEVDVELTKDGHPVAYHDFDFLPDYTCINSYNLADLQTKVPYIPSLEAVLNQAKQYNRKSPHTSGILVIELKTPSPLCDPGDSSEQLLVTTVTDTVRKLGMQSAVIFDGFSPALLYIAQQYAPEIPRELDLAGAQLLTPAQVQAITGLPVTIVPKQINLGLTWANIGVVYRLPGYSSVQQFLSIAYFVGASVVGFERDVLDGAEAQQPGAAAYLVAGARSVGFKVFADPAKTAADFSYFAGLGVDGAYTDDIPGSLAFQPTLP